MISTELNTFFKKYLWMIEEVEYTMFNSKDGKVVPTKVLNGHISKDEYHKRCAEFFDQAEKLLDKTTLTELATMFKTADIDLGSQQLNDRWKSYLTVKEDVMESIYKQMDKIDDNKSLNEKYNVRTLEDVKRLVESVNNITEAQIRAALATWKDTVGYGFITIGKNAVRYTSEELDFQQYVKMDDLVNAVNADEELTLEYIMEDPMILTDYFTDKCGASHYFELEEFIEKSTELNLEYFGVEIVDEVDTDLRSAAESSYDEFDEAVLKEALEKTKPARSLGYAYSIRDIRSNAKKIANETNKHEQRRQLKDLTSGCRVTIKEVDDLISRLTKYSDSLHKFVNSSRSDTDAQTLADELQDLSI